MLVNHFLENTTARLPDKTALVCGDNRLTYREINESAGRLGDALADLGVMRQDRVIVFLENCPESVISLFGILKAGAVFVILNPTMKAKKLNYILRDSGARAIITQRNRSGVIEEAIKETMTPLHVIWIREPPIPCSSDESGTVHHQWKDLFSPIRRPRLRGSSACIDVDLATIIYTSGSTGEPKGVMSSHGNMVSAARSIVQYLENTPDDIILNVLPLSFDYGLYQVLMAFMFGGTIVLEKSFLYPLKILERIEKERVTGFPIVPTITGMILKMEGLSASRFISLRYITNTAAALPVYHIRRLRELLPHVKIYSMYGLTECKRVSYLPPEEIDRQPTSVGKAIPNSEVFVMDAEGREAAPDEVGELVVRGANVMQGYWNAPELTATTFRQGRYPGERLLYSGDLFKKDEEGFLYFVGRKDDMIKTKGERVSPKEIENILTMIPSIAEAAVIGVPDELLGQAIEAFVVMIPTASLSERDVLKYCTENMEPFMVPKVVEFVTELPKTPNGKIDKKKLKEDRALQTR